MKRLHRIVKSILPFLILNGCAYAQSQFKWRAALPMVDTAGYYRINLQPEVTAKSKADLSDIRILGDDNYFVPFVKPGQTTSTNQVRYLDFPEVKFSGIPDSISAFIGQNYIHKPIDQLWLSIRNNSVNRFINLSGSDDLKHWFTISENLPMAMATESDNQGHYTQKISFPVSNYLYLRVMINNGHSTPINIIGIGTYQVLSANIIYLPVIPSKFIQKENRDTTHLYLRFKGTYPINQLRLTVNKQGYFKRQINVYENNARHHNLCEQFITNDSTQITLAASVKSLDIQIINHDDQPLKIKYVQTFQQERYLVAWLKAKTLYTLFFGNPAAATPKYDIEFFKEKISRTLVDITHQRVETNPDYKVVVPTRPKDYAWLLWLAIGVTVIILLTLTLRMAKEVKAR